VLLALAIHKMAHKNEKPAVTQCQEQMVCNMLISQLQLKLLPQDTTGAGWIVLEPPSTPASDGTNASPNSNSYPLVTPFQRTAEQKKEDFQMLGGQFD